MLESSVPGLSECQIRLLIKILKLGWLESSKVHHISAESVRRRMPGPCLSSFNEDIAELARLGFLKSRSYPALTREAYPITRRIYAERMRKSMA